MTKLISTNPAKNYEVVGEVEISTSKDVLEVVNKSHNTKILWKNLGVERRKKHLQEICDKLLEKKDEIIELIVNENGKIRREAVYELKGGIEEFQWFIDNVGNSIKDEITHEDDSSIHKIRHEPYGVAGVITPWNFPFANILRGIVPNLLVGNTVVLKVSEETPLMGKLFEEVMKESSLPDGVFGEVYGNGEVGSFLSHSELNYIWFTGSTAVGQELYKIAAEKMIPVTLELGGSNPCIVFEDVDIDEAIETIYGGRFFNCGEVCDSIKRLIIHESISDKFNKKFVEFLDKKIVGNPNNDLSDMGSLIAERQCILLNEQIQDGINKGAKILCGGGKKDTLEGAYFEPTLIADITFDMRLWSEEVFGPVLPILTFTTEDEAIKLANDTIYGLGSRVMSGDIERARRVASQIDAGSVEINHGSRWLSNNPFGGYKKSGIGREHGEAGFREISQIKVISESK